MQNRVRVLNQFQVVGEATPELNMKAKIHDRTSGAGAPGLPNPSDYLKISDIGTAGNPIITLVSQVTGQTYYEYAYNVYVDIADSVLNTGGTWPSRNTHWPFQ